MKKRKNLLSCFGLLPLLGTATLPMVSCNNNNQPQITIDAPTAETMVLKSTISAVEEESELYTELDGFSVLGANLNDLTVEVTSNFYGIGAVRTKLIGNNDSFKIKMMYGQQILSFPGSYMLSIVIRYRNEQIIWRSYENQIKIPTLFSSFSDDHEFGGETLGYISSVLPIVKDQTHEYAIDIQVDPERRKWDNCSLVIKPFAANSTYNFYLDPQNINNLKVTVFVGDNPVELTKNDDYIIKTHGIIINDKENVKNYTRIVISGFRIVSAAIRLHDKFQMRVLKSLYDDFNQNNMEECQLRYVSNGYKTETDLQPNKEYSFTANLDYGDYEKYIYPIEGTPCKLRFGFGSGLRIKKTDDLIVYFNATPIAPENYDVIESDDLIQSITIHNEFLVEYSWMLDNNLIAFNHAVMNIEEVMKNQLVSFSWIRIESK